MKVLKFPRLALLLLVGFNAAAQNNIKPSLSMDPDKSILKNAEDSGNHQFLLAAVKVSDLETILDTSGPFTVFAPSDLNFDSEAHKKLTELVRIKNADELQSLVGYHIVAGHLSASKILKALCSGKGKASFTTITGDKLVATMKGLDIILTDKHGNQSVITKADKNQCNGVMHEIDSISRPIKI